MIKKAAHCRYSDMGLRETRRDLRISRSEGYDTLTQVLFEKMWCRHISITRLFSFPILSNSNKARLY